MQTCGSVSKYLRIAQDMKDSFEISINNTGFNKTNKTATIRTHKIVRQTIYLTGKSNGCLLKHINNSPGIHYRELQRAIGFANGVLAYHLMVREKSVRIKANRYLQERVQVIIL